MKGYLLNQLLKKKGKIIRTLISEEFKVISVLNLKQLTNEKISPNLSINEILII